MKESPIILTGGGCGLNGSLEELFQSENTRLTRYPGQVLSYNVIEEWAAHGIGAGILPKAKLSPTNKVACPLILNNGQAAKYSYKWIWNPDILEKEDLAAFVQFLQTRIPILLKNEVKLALV
ncbi:MAG: hypothetical protein QM479_07530 [Pseudomonadota bacterium]